MEWQRSIQFWYQRFLLAFAQCDLCGNNLDQCNLEFHHQGQQKLLCTCCLADLPLFNQKMIQGDLLNWPAINKALPKCTFDHLVSLSPYLPPFAQWLPQYKYNGRFELGVFFATLLAEQYQKLREANYIPAADLVLSVPLHITKWQIRGYNQAHLIAKPFAKYLTLAYDEQALVRIKHTKSQVGQKGTERRKNLANSFSLIKELPDNTQHVILLDDVLTTGSTASEISKILKRAGVKTVTVVTVCLTLPSH